MNKIKITTPTTGKDRKRLLQFPWDIYKDDPYWIPPILSEEKGLLGYGKDPFYDRNKIRTFMATRDDKIVGRIAAIVNYGHLERYNDGVGFFGFFESIDDQEVADALFNAAIEWLKDVYPDIFTDLSKSLEQVLKDATEKIKNIAGGETTKAAA